MFVFIATGVLKLTNSPQEVAAFVTWGYPLWLMYFTGVLNIVCAVGLSIRKVSQISATVLMALLTTAIISNILAVQSPLSSVPAMMLLCSLAYILYIDNQQTRKRS